MSTHTSTPTDATIRSTSPTAPPTVAWTAPTRVPMGRLVGVELRKSFDTRSGRWLLAGLGLAALLTTGAIIAWA